MYIEKNAREVGGTLLGVLAAALLIAYLIFGLAGFYSQWNGSWIWIPLAVILIAEGIIFATSRYRSFRLATMLATIASWASSISLLVYLGIGVFFGGKNLLHMHWIAAFLLALPAIVTGALMTLRKKNPAIKMPQNLECPDQAQHF